MSERSLRQEHIRNFVIIAHVDHGKSTLADRLLDITGTIEKRKMQEQFLDLMPLEREKGITIKMQPVRMLYRHKSVEYILNLIDTPGHVDFSYEVSRSLAAVEGAILLVDAAKGVQAQTLANLRLAKQQGLAIIPAVNKIDLPSARTEEVAQELAEMLQIQKEEIFRISAKQGLNVEELLGAVVERVPSPQGSAEVPLRALIFDSLHDAHLGVVAHVRVMEGEVKQTDKLFLLGSKTPAFAKEVGYFIPGREPIPVLHTGEIGYIATGVKESDKVRIGDTITEGSHAKTQSYAQALPGFKIPKPVVFVSFYPEDPNDFDVLREGFRKLHLQDPSFTFEQEFRDALGRGFRCGFLGVLHSEIIAERLKREFGLELVLSRPSVEYQITDTRGRELLVKSAGDWLDPSQIQQIKEPWARVEVLAPPAAFSGTLQVLEAAEGKQVEMRYLGDQTTVLVYEFPLRELIQNLHDRLKSASSGLASLEYEIIGMQPADLVKLDVLVAGVKREELSQIVPVGRAYQEGKVLVAKLKKLLPKQLFVVPLQAALGGKIIARETIGAQRRDVTAPLYGGDVTRKRKLLERQKEGKKELAGKARIRIPARVFLEIFRNE
ncbi:MAG: elongation factor 4 [Parcubacteria group bacterium]|nr:elongation factor 4 [Parcubacteria group bacterium]